MKASGGIALLEYAHDHIKGSRAVQLEKLHEHRARMQQLSKQLDGLEERAQPALLYELEGILMVAF